MLAFYQTGLQAGFLESITDAESQVTRFEYDAIGRVKKNKGQALLKGK